MIERTNGGVLPSLLLVGALILCATAVSVALPDARASIFEEDRLVEWLTVMAFAAAGILGIRKLRQWASSDLLLLIVTGLAILAVLDELSFGERLLGWEAPRVLGIKLDAVHDFILIGKTLIARSTEHPYLVALLVLVVAAALAAAMLVWAKRRGWRVVLGAEFVLICGSVLCLALAQGIDVDLKVLRSDLLKPLYVEEVLELGAGVLLLCFVLLRRDDGRLR